MNKMLLTVLFIFLFYTNPFYATEPKEWLQMDEVASWDSRTELIVSNPTEVDLENAIILVKLSEINIKAEKNGQLVLVEKETNFFPPQQVDDIDDDKIMDELVFICSIKKTEKKQFWLYHTKSGRAWLQQKRQTYALNIPAWESEFIGFRSYGAMTIDVFARKSDHPGLMLAHFYNDKNQQIFNYHRESLFGMDVLHIRGTSGLAGVVLVNDNQTFIPVDASFTAKVICSGHVRSVIEMTQSPIEVFGGQLQIIRKATIYSGWKHSLIEDTVKILKPLPTSARFGIGIRKEVDFREKYDLTNGIFIHQHNQGDDIGEVCIAFALMEGSIEKITEDNQNRFFLFSSPLADAQSYSFAVNVFAEWKRGDGTTDIDTLYKKIKSVLEKQKAEKFLKYQIGNTYLP